MQRYEDYPIPPNYDPRFDGILPSKLLKFGRIDASIILLSSNRNIEGDFQHKIAQFQRTVISSPRIRNFVPFEITFRRLRARWALLGCHNATLPLCHIKHLRDFANTLFKLLYIIIYNNYNYYTSPTLHTCHHLNVAKWHCGKVAD